jgi:hypothetical protein
MNTVFAVSSWGNAGVPWVVKCVNLDPRIRSWSCMAYAAHSPMGLNWTPVEYLDALARLGWQDYVACGDVHALGPDFTDLEKAFGDRFRGGHLMGHPVPRLAGSFAFSRELGRDWKHQDFLRLWNMAPDDPRAVAALEVLGPEGDHVPAHYMVNVNNVVLIADGAGPLREPVFRLEDLMASDRGWTEMIAHLSAGVIEDYGSRWRPMQDVFVGVAHQPFAAGPRAVWDGLPDYVRKMFVVALTDAAREAYTALGYDLSFVR